MESTDRERAGLSNPTQGEDAFRLATEAQWWARERNVEAVWCWLPTFDQICDANHTVTAVGNDGMAVNIVVDNERAERAGAVGDQLQLAYLGRMLMQVRRAEALSG
jgi:hypothetical protein